MGKYEEDVYSRAEKQFPDLAQQISWLSSFSGKKGDYADDAITVASSLQRSIEISKEAEEEADLSRLREIQSEARGLKFKGPDVEEVVIKSVRTAEEVQVEERKRIELESKGKLTTIYRNELKRADSEAEIDSILREAESELGEGKNLESLEEAGDILRRRL